MLGEGVLALRGFSAFVNESTKLRLLVERGRAAVDACFDTGVLVALERVVGL
jgi:hypothetical protein